LEHARDHRLEPAQMPPANNDYALAAAVELTPVDAAPRADASDPQVEAPPQESALPPIALSLPALEEAPDQTRTEGRPRVSAGTSPVARPAVADYATESDALPRARSAALAPDSQTSPLETVNVPLTPSLEQRRNDAHVPTPPLPEVVPTSAEPRPLALDLRLPDETEPPARDRDPRYGQAPIKGRVTDSATGQPLAGATVRLDLPDAEPLTVTTDTDGQYALAVPPVPDHFALSASHEDYVPASVDVPAAALRRGTVIRDFELEPRSADVIAIEVEPVVHHLGNDRWEGRINSQFQKTSEGRQFSAEFVVAAGQLPPHTDEAVVFLMAKGVQCPHQIYVNDYRLRQRLDSSPADGSFGEFTAPFHPAILVAGTNTVEIHGVACMGDLDDFEFVNVQIRLSR
jgi:hypothetical protein